VVSRRLTFAVPGELSTPTGGYAYDRRIISELSQLGWHLDVLNLGEGFPQATAPDREAARQLLMTVPVGCPIVVDGLALGVLPEAACEVSQHHPLIALVHHPLAFESGLTRATADALRVSERAALAYARCVVVTSPAMARLAADEYAVDTDRLFTVSPGTDRAILMPRAANVPIQLLTVGAIVPRKAYDVLAAALARLTDLPWHLTIVGDRSRDRAASQALDRDLKRYDLVDRVTVEGVVGSKRLDALYGLADLFVLPSRFEGYGMVFAEAIAHGIPIVATCAGAIPDTVPDDAGILVQPDDVTALAAALRSLIEQPETRRRLAEAAQSAAVSLPTWRDAALLFARAIEAIL